LNLEFEKEKRRYGKVLIHQDFIEEVIQLVLGEYTEGKGHKARVIKLDLVEGESGRKKYFAAILEGPNLPLLKEGSALPVVYRIDEREAQAPVDSFRRSRKIGKALNSYNKKKVKLKIKARPKKRLFK